MGAGFPQFFPIHLRQNFPRHTFEEAFRNEGVDFFGNYVDGGEETPLAGNVFDHLLELLVVADEGAGWRATQEVQDSMALVCFPLEEGRLWEGE
jgi:hypothetical protein